MASKKTWLDKLSEKKEPKIKRIDFDFADIPANVSVCPSTYFLIKKVFLALGQKNETSLHRKSATEICSGLRELFFISKGLLSVKKHIYLPLLSLEEALRARSVNC